MGSQAGATAHATAAPSLPLVSQRSVITRVGMEEINGNLKTERETLEMKKIMKFSLASTALALQLLLVIPSANAAGENQSRPRPTPTPTPRPSATPKPTPGLVKVPHGIANLLASDQRITEDLFTNPAIGVIRIRTSWDSIQSSASSYDWSAIDTARDYARTYGKQLIISVVMCAGAPQFVYDAGAKSITLTSYDNATRMPVPWDPVMLAKETTFINAFAAHLDSDPVVTAIVMGGLGIVIEGYIGKTTQEISQLNAAGGLPAYVTGAKNLIDAYAAAFKQTPFIYTAAKPYSQSGGQSEMTEIGDYGATTYPGRFGIMNAQLKATTTATSGSNALIAEYHNTNPTGFQFVTNSAGLGGHDLGGSVEQTLNAGIAIGPPNWIEVYSVDANDPRYSALFQSVAKELAP